MGKIFINLGEAAAMLLGAGLTVKMDERKFEGHANPSKGLTVLVDGTEVAVAWGYRDGATWKFKSEHIEEFVEGHERAKLQSRFYGFGEAPRAKADGYDKVQGTFFGTRSDLLKKYGHIDVVFVVSASGDNDRFEWYVVAKGENNG